MANHQTSDEDEQSPVKGNGVDDQVADFRASDEFGISRETRVWFGALFKRASQRAWGRRIAGIAM